MTGLVFWALTGSSIAAENPLDVEPRQQQDNLLCWAACVEMVVDFLDINRRQCQIVNAEFSFDSDLSCCGSDTDHWEANCNRVSFGTTALTELTGHEPDVREKPLRWSSIKREINGGHPILWTYYTNKEDRRGHMVVIFGYEEDGTDKWLHCWDPSKRPELGTALWKPPFDDYRANNHWATTWKIRAE